MVWKVQGVSSEDRIRKPQEKMERPGYSVQGMPSGARMERLSVIQLLIVNIVVKLAAIEFIRRFFWES